MALGFLGWTPQKDRKDEEGYSANQADSCRILSISICSRSGSAISSTTASSSATAISPTGRAYHRDVKLLLLLGLIGAVGLAPFVVIKRPWAVRVWSQIKLFVVVYIIVVLLAGILRLVFNWEDIYG